MPLFHNVTAIAISGAFVFGIILVLLGGIRPLLGKRLGVPDARVDWLLSALNLALIPMMLLSGVLTDQLGVKPVFIVGALVTAIALYLLALSERYLHALRAVFLVGAGAACLSTGSSVLMLKAFFPDNEAASQNLGNVFFALGALAAPVLAEWAVDRLGYRRALTLLALGCLLPALLAALTVGDAFPPAGRPTSLTEVLGSPLLWLCGLVLLLYGPLEGSLGTWARTYLSDQGISHRWTTWLLSGYWLTFLAARLLAALLQHRGILPKVSSDAWLILGLALATAVFLGNMVSARTHFTAALGLLLVGACFGPIFPTLVAILLNVFREDRGTAYGAMFSIGATGSLFLPPLISAFARRNTVQQAMRIPLVTALVLAVVALILALARTQFLGPGT
jgi:fucose permease